jgi:hypothetical protein
MEELVDEKAIHKHGELIDRFKEMLLVIDDGAES